jgi:hypothetical protein
MSQINPVHNTAFSLSLRSILILSTHLAAYFYLIISLCPRYDWNYSPCMERARFIPYSQEPFSVLDFLILIMLFMWNFCALHTCQILVFLRSVRRLLAAACVVPSSPIFVTLVKEAPGFSETSVLTRATRRNNPEDTILHSHRRENLKSYMSNSFVYCIV